VYEELGIQAAHLLTSSFRYDVLRPFFDSLYLSCENMGELDIETLLQNGYWSNSRARSPDPRR
jgi:hypothetical protein